jgi:hypothetical protein
VVSTRLRSSALALSAAAVLVFMAAAPAGGQRSARTAAHPVHDRAFDVRGKARDSVTGTRRLVARRRGFLTGRSKASPSSVALGFVRRNPDAFGLDGGDVAGLRPVRRYRWGSGATHLQWEQTYRGIPVFGTEVRANVARDGRLINAGGAPLPDPSVRSIAPKLSERAAVRAAGGRNGSGELVLFPDLERVRLAWRVRAEEDSQHVWDAVVDAQSAKLLYRRNLVLKVAALAFDNYPGAPRGGSQQLRDFPPAWLGSCGGLQGNNAHVYPDPEDGDVPALGDEIQCEGGVDYTYGTDFRAATHAPQGQDCPPVGCSYNNFAETGDPPIFSWRENGEQAGTQLFYYVNRFHDHLRDAPGIGFTAASGGFEGGDRLRAEVNNGAATDSGAFDDLPDCSYLNNADMTIGPDGTSPRMQMYLWSSACFAPSVVVNDVDGANDAFIVYHEYAHGLSSRLVTDAAGVGALAGLQSGAMGEGWSDWYALDFLVAAGFEVDTAAPGELRTGQYEAEPVRTEPFDCPVGGGPPSCPGTPFGGPGGYTYGDFGHVASNAPEVHDDGEIWVQALWDLRRALTAKHGNAEGVTRARAYITDGMRLSPASPSFLAARNAILQADANGGLRDRDLIWAVFAARGMGMNARTTGDNDRFPVEDFTRPPPLAVPDTTPAVISRFSMSRKRFRLGRTRTPRTAATKRGSAFRFRLSEGADVTITIHRGLSGRRVGKSCRKPSRRLRKRRKCTRYVRRAALRRRKLKAGSRRVSFTGRIGSTKLKVGRYRATISATDAAKNRSKSRRTSFRVVRR